MNKKICIFGAGGFAHEVFWLAHQCGQIVDAFIDIKPGSDYEDVPVKDENYFNEEKHLAVIAIGNPSIRQKTAFSLIEKYGKKIFTCLIHESVKYTDNVIIGAGSIICANCVLTCDIKLGDFSQLNLATTIGHDTVTGDYFTTAPGAHISGKVKIGNKVYLGTNASTVEDITICDDVTIGAGACVSKDILESGVYVGVPARKLEKKTGN